MTVVLIGAETSERKYVQYEINQSCNKGNGLLGVYIHKLKNKDGNADYKGKNPFDNFFIERGGRKVYLSEIYSAYDWVNDDSYNNFGDWVEEAATKAGT